MSGGGGGGGGSGETQDFGRGVRRWAAEQLTVANITAAVVILGAGFALMGEVRANTEQRKIVEASGVVGLPSRVAALEDVARSLEQDIALLCFAEVERRGGDPFAKCSSRRRPPQR